MAILFLLRSLRLATMALVVAQAASTFSCHAADEPVETFGRSVAKLKKSKTLKIGYFGGSITVGAGSSNPAQKSWRALTTRWFKEHFPDAKITELNASIGGTGSDLAAFRCQADLMNHDPDSVFVEFAVNDGYQQSQRVQRSMEGIVRQIFQVNPDADIIFIYTTTKPLAGPYAKGELPTAVRDNHAVAAHYNIPEINVGRVLAERISKGDTWETLTTDGVHPNDAGYVVYADTIKEFLESHQQDPAAPSVFDMPFPLTKDPLCGAKMEDATGLHPAGWTVEEKSMAGQYPHFISASTPGTELTYTFTGTTVGLYWLIAPDSGEIEWTIDGSPPKRLSAWDKYSIKTSRANYAILSDDLSSGEHVLKITVQKEKNPLSTGTWIRIGAFLVHCPC